MSKKNRGRKSLGYEIDSEGLEDMDETEASSTESTGAVKPTAVRIVNARQVYIRSAPVKEDGNEIGIAAEGDVFELLEPVDDYCKIRLKDGSVGYVMYDFCGFIRGIAYE